MLFHIYFRRQRSTSPKRQWRRSGDASSWAIASGRTKAKQKGRWPNWRRDKLRERLRQLTRRTRGRSLEQIAADLRDYVPGWKSYFRLAQTPKTMRDLDQWLRHRLRAMQLKQWRSGPTIFRELRRMGASADDAASIAGNARRWWHNSALALNRVLTIAYFDRLGVPKFS